MPQVTTPTALPCPFCGGVPKVLQREHPAIKHVPLAWVVQCSACTAETCSEYRQWAVDYWNRRAMRHPAAMVSELEELEAGLREKMGHYQWSAYLDCADRIAALITKWKQTP